jgi:hypothetical protein
MDEAAELADRVGIMDHGRLLALDTPDALTSLVPGQSTLEIGIQPDAAGPRGVDGLVAVEKMLFGTLRALLAGVVMFPIGWLVLGTLPIRGERLWMLALFLLLGAVMGAGLGLTLGTAVKPKNISVVFAVVLTPLLFTGCSQYPWPSLDRLPWFRT